MSGAWRLAVEGVLDIQAPHLRLADVVKRVRSKPSRPELTNLVLIVSVDNIVRRTKSFDIRRDGTTTLLTNTHDEEVIFINEPQKSDYITLTLIKQHRVERNALIGEARVRPSEGSTRANLLRKGKVRGVLVLSLSPALPSFLEDPKDNFKLERIPSWSTSGSLGSFGNSSFCSSNNHSRQRGLCRSEIGSSLSLETATPDAETTCSETSAAKLADTRKAVQCACGSVFMKDALFCRKCGKKRPEVASPRIVLMDVYSSNSSGCMGFLLLLRRFMAGSAYSK